MARYIDKDHWEEEILIPNTNTPILGGQPVWEGDRLIDGFTNISSAILADRTRHLKNKIDNIEADVDAEFSSFIRKEDNLSDLEDIQQAKYNLGLNLVDNTRDLDKPVSVHQAAAIQSVRDDLASSDPGKGAHMIGYATTTVADALDTLEQRITDLPEQVDAAGTAEAKVGLHNNDPSAHPELSAFISSEADRAEAAADAATVNSRVYQSIQDGLDETVDGDYFLVIGVSLDEAAYLYLNTNNQAELQKIYPTLNAVISAKEKGEYAVDITKTKASKERVILGGFESPERDYVEVDGMGNIVGGPRVIRALIDKIEDIEAQPQEDLDRIEAITTTKETISRVILSGSLENKDEYVEVDVKGNIVGGPGVMREIVDRISNKPTEENYPAQPLFIAEDGIKTRSAQGAVALADSDNLPYEFIDQPVWYRKGVVVGTTRETISSETPAIVLPRGNEFIHTEMIIPSADNLLILIPSFGQSNSVGAQSYVPDAIMTQNKWGDRILMPAGDGFMDVRLGLNSGQESVGAETALDPETITGFKPLVSLQSQLIASQGSTHLEGIAFGLASELERALGYVPRMCFFTAGWGGRYQSQLAKGSIPYQNMMDAISRIKELAESEGWKVWVPGLVLVHGESDSQRPSYLTSIRTWQEDIEADIQAITGQSGGVPFFASQASTFFGRNTNGVMAVYLGAKETSTIHITTPYYPYPLVSDNLHLGKSAVLVGEKIGHAMARLVSGFGVSEYGGVFPTSVQFDGNDKVQIEFHVPVGPLVLDTDDPVVNSPTPENYGFAVYDGNGDPVTISSVVVQDGNKIVVTLDNTPAVGASRRVDYALVGFGSPKVNGEQPRGCLRDSDSIKFYYTGGSAYNWCPHFSENF